MYRHMDTHMERHMDCHMESHMDSHMENENENENEDVNDIENTMKRREILRNYFGDFCVIRVSEKRASPSARCRKDF